MQGEMIYGESTSKLIEGRRGHLSVTGMAGEPKAHNEPCIWWLFSISNILSPISNILLDVLFGGSIRWTSYILCSTMISLFLPILLLLLFLFLSRVPSLLLATQLWNLLDSPLSMETHPNMAQSCQFYFHNVLKICPLHHQHLSPDVTGFPQYLIHLLTSSLFCSPVCK